MQFKGNGEAFVKGFQHRIEHIWRPMVHILTAWTKKGMLKAVKILATI
jgi:hypothetical protein